MTPQELLDQGRKILDPLMGAHGFQFRLTQVGQGSGGHFAVGTYTSGEWKLELHVRGTLGIVNYQVGDAILEHRSYMDLLGVRQQAEYPGFSSDPLDAFRHLRTDLERFAGEFLRKENREFFREAARRLQESPRPSKR